MIGTIIYTGKVLTKKIENMKKIIILISCISTALSSFSQNNNNIDPPVPAEQSVFSIGPQGGFGHSYITPCEGGKFQPSWDAGISAVYAPGVHWGIELDIRYSAEGRKFERTIKRGDAYYTETSVAQLNYWRIPLKGVYFFRTYEHDFRPKITLGPTIGFLTSQINSVGAKSVDFGANASLGFNYRLVRAIWLTADVNYYQGFVDVYENTSDKELNGNVRLDLGVSFGF
jgi:hypothetical protein